MNLDQLGQPYPVNTPSVTINVPDTTQQASLADLFNLMSATVLQMANRVAELEAKLNKLDFVVEIVADSSKKRSLLIASVILKLHATCFH